MGEIYRNISAGAILSVGVCWLLSMLIPGELVVMIAVCALPGVIVGATVTVLDYLKNAKDKPPEEEKDG